MFKQGPSKKTLLDRAIDNIYLEMESLNADQPEYAKMVKQLTKLYSLKEQEAPKRVDPNTVLTVSGNLAAVLMIIGYERAHVVATKALSFVLKP